jgi:hypothetical protein
MPLDSMIMGAPGGQYRLIPGVPCSISGQRPVLADGRLGRLLRGQRGEQVGRTLSGVFTLCAHAHRRAARMALSVASSGSQHAQVDDAPVLLLVETARDHLRSIALDWPQRQFMPVDRIPDMSWLRECPLSLGTGRSIKDDAAAWSALAELRAWVQRCILEQSIPDWLAANRQADAFAAWCEGKAQQLHPARCLATWHRDAQALKPEARCLDVLDDDAPRQEAQLRQLAESMAGDPEFVRRPTWMGECAESGPWARLRHRREQGAQARSAWTRLSARWIELMEIAATDQREQTCGLLASGALQLSDGQALAWCEMARGLLLHWVRLDGGAIDDYRVLAPTEWNFHPGGALARALTALAPGDMVAASTLAAAYDPCVACTVGAPGQQAGSA